MYWRIKELPMRKMKLLSNHPNVLMRSILFIVIVLIVSGCSILPKEEEVLAPPLVEPAQIEYDTVTVEKGEIVRRVQGAGTLMSSDLHDLYFTRDGGRLKEILVSEGDLVQSGDVLAEIETSTLALEIQQLKIDLKKAELRLEQLRADKADKYSIEIAKLDIESIQNRLNHLNNELASSKIVAPVNGTVVYVSDIQQGEYIGAYETIMRVAETDQLQIRYTAISENDIRDVNVGMEVNIKIQGEIVKGEVIQTPQEVPHEEFQLNPELYSKSLLIGSDELPAELNAGDIVEIEIITARKENALIIPNNALRNTGDRYFVQILEDNSRREVDVEVGIRASTQVEVVTGLEEGDTIILK